MRLARISYEEDKLKMSYHNDTLQNQMSELQLKINSQTKIIEGLRNEDKDQYWNQSWVSVEKDGKRLDRLIRMLEKKVKPLKDIDQIIKLCNAIGFLTGKKHEYQNEVLQIKKIIKENK